METTKLKSLTIKELSEFADKLKIQDYIGLKKQDLIKLQQGLLPLLQQTFKQATLI